MTAWFLDNSHWIGPDGILARLFEHVTYSAVALLAASIVALPIGLYVGHTRRGVVFIAGLANVLRALPTLGIIVFLVILLGPVFSTDLAFIVPSLIVLVLLAIPPIMSGAYAGMVAVDPAAVDAARGMGYRPLGVLFSVELPCALPLILSGFRGATLQIISTATIAAYVSLGGLGRLIIDGRAQNDYLQMEAGALLIGVLALVVDISIGLLSKVAVSRGLIQSARSSSLPRGRSWRLTTKNGRILVGLIVTCGVIAALLLITRHLVANATKGGVGAITIGSADFPESELLATIYAQAIAAKGVAVNTKLSIGSREVYIPALLDGSIDVIPEYSGSMLGYLDKTVTVSTPQDVATALKKALPKGLETLAWSPAQDSDVIAVTRATAETYRLKTIADLKPVAGTLVIGGSPEFKARRQGLVGLGDLYGLKFKSFKVLDVAGPLTLSALLNDQIAAADMNSTDPAIEKDHLIVLKDTKNLYQAQNIVPVFAAKRMNDQVAKVLNAVSAALTTDDLITMNASLADHDSLDEVADRWLKLHKLN